jgi:phage host-nuclease inhibitor protein Gam
MSIKLKKILDLPDPSRMAAPDVQAHLKKLNEALQDWNRRLRDALVNNGTSGTAIIDNGTTRMTVTIEYGMVTVVSTGASGGATLSWTAS